ncbi:UNVERIFIED_CONTAM: hypothetical protein GTU68_030951 [Idotea baltica]|nr:hypothetical protein [Idotea baltica]
MAKRVLRGAVTALGRHQWRGR